MDERIEFVREQLTVQEILCQLAEEAAELAQAALKLRRAMDGRNPTPVSSAEAMACVTEEIADVRLCLRLLRMDQESRCIQERKLERWCRRLKGEEPCSSQ